MSAALPFFAGLLSPAAQTVGLFIWQNRWKSDALSLNCFKGCFSSLFHGAVALATTASFSEAYLPGPVWMMILSSVLGIVIADTWWLIALASLGARRMIAIDTIKPFLALGLGAALLGDKITFLAVAGVVVTTTGIFFVNYTKIMGGGDTREPKDKKWGSIEHLQGVSSPLANSSVKVGPKLIAKGTSGKKFQEMVSSPRGTVPENSPGATIGDHEEAGDAGESSLSKDPPTTTSDSDATTEGRDFVAYMYAVGNVALDVYSAALTVQYHRDLSAADVSFIRFGFAGVALAFAVAVREAYRSINPSPEPTPSESLEKGKGGIRAMNEMDWMGVAGGTIFVTVLGPLLNTWVMFKLPLGIAITLNSTTPLFSLPVAWWYDEVVDRIAMAGAVLSTAGVVMLVMGE